MKTIFHIIFIVFIAAMIICLVKEIKNLKNEEIQKKENYIQLVKENSFYGDILEIIYLNKDKDKKSDPASNAVAGAGTAYLLGFGPIGMIAGAAIGVEEGKENNKPEEELYLICLESATQDTFCFKILNYYPFPNIYQEIFYNIGLRDSFDSLEGLKEKILKSPENKIAIVSSEQLSPYSKIIAGFIYLNEKIPHLEE